MAYVIDYDRYQYGIRLEAAHFSNFRLSRISRFLARICTLHGFVYILCYFSDLGKVLIVRLLHRRGDCDRFGHS